MIEEKTKRHSVVSNVSAYNSCFLSLLPSRSFGLGALFDKKTDDQAGFGK